MSERHAGELEEQLCCLMDNELADSQARFLFSRLENDAELRKRWERMHMARAVMQDHRYTSLDGFGARVAAAVDSETPEPMSAGERTRHWLQPLAGAAIAASVAVVAFNLWQTPTTEMADTPMALVDKPTADLMGEVNAGASQIAIPAVAGAGQQASNAILQQYMIRHAQATGGSGIALQHIYVVSDPVRDPRPENLSEAATEGDDQTAR